MSLTLTQLRNKINTWLQNNPPTKTRNSNVNELLDDVINNAMQDNTIWDLFDGTNLQKTEAPPVADEFSPGRTYFVIEDGDFAGLTVTKGMLVQGYVIDEESYTTGFQIIYTPPACELTGLWKDVGNYVVNNAGNIDYPSTGGSGVSGAILLGNIWTLKNVVEGISTLNNLPIENNGTVRALVDNPSPTNDEHWAIGDSIDIIPNLQKVSDEGGLDNGSTIKKGTVDNGHGKGISRICTVDKEDQWENGVRYLRVVGSANVYAETIEDIIPDESYDDTKGWQVGSRFKNLVKGMEYTCLDPTTGAAIWKLEPYFVRFKVELLSTAIYDGSPIDISELPEVTGYFWEVISCASSMSNQTIAYDNGIKFAIWTDGCAKEQFESDPSFAIANNFTQMIKRSQEVMGNITNYRDGSKVQLLILGTPTIGDGDATFYGTATLIKT